jgi:hypothetical protein
VKSLGSVIELNHYQPAEESKMSTKNIARVCADDNMHTCIELSRENQKVKFIPMTVSGFEVEQLSVVEFDRTYNELQDYPVDKAAKLYVGYATDTGGSLEAMQNLAKLTPLTKGEIDMATKKAASAKSEAKKPTAKPATKKAAPVAKAPAEKAVTKREPATKKSPTEKKPSASGMFKELIMAGTMTDEAIFKKVKKAFDLSDDKISYVKWYRNDLTKKGMNPPTAK